MNVIFNTITEIAEYIAEKNTYFDKYFDYAIQDETTGNILSGETAVFPSDIDGNYFYFRFPHTFSFDYNNSFMIADAQGGVGVSGSFVLVACVREANAFLLMQNLINTIGLMCNINVKFDKTMFGDNVILQECAKFKDKKDIEAALQKIADNYTLVAINFTLKTPFIYSRSNCITNPCQVCS